eukprot:TRINITY_DN105330_c2_g1_i1.p1 TRINITY_DN105330_c2_g1~~TRINITY_DN105330_c2_g1_i1.p1  ORF type:complete len:692 (-),score=45.05 TRINITY_DN105330_c2_g1_i1:51-2126(-)
MKPQAYSTRPFPLAQTCRTFSTTWAISIWIWYGFEFIIRKQMQQDKALPYYTRALELLPGFAAARCNIGTCYRFEGRIEEAVTQNIIAVQLNPFMVDPYVNLGNLFKDVGRLDECLVYYKRAVELEPANHIHYSNLGVWFSLNNLIHKQNALKDANKNVEAIYQYRKALELNPWNSDAFCNLLHSELFICDWSRREENFKLLRDHIYYQINNGITPSCQPFHALIYPLDSMDKLLLARKYAERDLKSALQNGKYKKYTNYSIHRLKLKNDRIKVGYVSFDFRNHPLAHLMQSVFGMHDRSQYEIFCFSLSESDNSPYRARIETDAEHFIDISKITNHAEAAQLIHSWGIDVLINLSGYTKGGRNEIFALEPAPIQISYMGFCSTMGAKYMHYFVGDKTVIPEEYTDIYEEKIIWMPHSYFVNDYMQSMRFVLDETKRPKRADYGLPEDKFIFANFNQIYKIDPDTFDVWMNILKRVPNSILWLLRFPPEGEANIRKEASKRGIAADRLIFTDVADKPTHVNRCFLADLCLDTPLCNGHTTGCDILWSGLPMVTMPLKELASRVGSGLCVALECPEMIKPTYEEYEEYAVELATGDPGSPSQLAGLPKRIVDRKGSLRLKKLRHKIEQKRTTAPLFDTRLWVKNWEKGIKEAVRLCIEKKQPRNIDVAVLQLGDQIGQQLQVQCIYNLTTHH